MRRRWTAPELEMLRAMYPDTKSEKIAAALGRKVGTVYQKAVALGLKKSATYLASPDACRLRHGDRVGVATQFKPGQASWNKGSHYTAGGRSAETRFKPGNRSGRAVALYQPVGTERISRDGYRERKINDDMPLQRRWRAVHLLAWEAVNGPLPKGHAVTFRDGNPKNIALENMELVTRAELMRRNSYHNKYPKEVAQAIQLRGALNRKINRMNKESTT